MDKSQIRLLTSQIRHVLMEFWDPIGVKDEPNAQDEYDCCIGGIVHLLTEGGTDEQITDYLYRQAIDHMGLSDGNTSQAEQKRLLNPTLQALRNIPLRSNCVPYAKKGGSPLHRPSLPKLFSLAATRLYQPRWPR